MHREREGEQLQYKRISANGNAQCAHYCVLTVNGATSVIKLF